MDFLLDDRLLGPLGDRDFLYNEGFCLIEHLAFAEGQVLGVAKQEEVAENFGNFVNGACFDLFHVITIPAIPGGLVDLHVTHFENGIDLGYVFVGDDAA